jgi:diaminopimelate epimerase
MKFPFTKMQALGNDFIVFDLLAGSPLAMTAKLAQKLCDRRHGIGADQILLVRPARDAAATSGLAGRMEVWNADGSEVEMCGNGIRAVGLYLASRAQGAKGGASRQQGEFKIETLAGVKTVYVSGEDVRVNLGEPKIAMPFAAEGIEVGGRKYHYYDVNLGNPHAVIFLEDHPGISLRTMKLEDVGSRIERSPKFPNRTNVEFVDVLSRKEIDVTVWERGAGWTLACGTGACAAAVAAIARGKVDLNVRVRLPGGVLRIEWAGPGRPIWMQGPAYEVFRGEVELGEAG